MFLSARAGQGDPLQGVTCIARLCDIADLPCAAADL